MSILLWIFLIALVVALVCFLIIVAQAGKASEFKRKIEIIASIAGIILAISGIAIWNIAQH